VHGASTLSPSANIIFDPIPGSGGDQNSFHADISFTIMTQAYLKIGSRDRQEGSVAQADGAFFKVQKKFFENGNTQRILQEGDLGPCTMSESSACPISPPRHPE
jgi:hypothetical protein